MAKETPVPAAQTRIRIFFPGFQSLLIDKDMVMEKSSWFRREIGAIVQSKKRRIVFQLGSDETGDSPLLQMMEDGVPSTDTVVKTEISRDDTSTLRIAYAHDIYKMFFSLMKGDNSQLTARITVSRLESVIALARYYDSTSSVLGGIKEYFLHFPTRLCEMVAQDPPRCLQLGAHHEWRFMYTPALIHCAGGFPGRAWPTTINSLDNALQVVIVERAQHLMIWAGHVNVELLTMTFFDSQSGEVVSDRLGKGQRELINMFREWLAEAIRSDKTQMLSGNIPAYQRATHFWKIYKRGDAYLPLADVLAHFSAVFGKKHTFDVQRYLSELKNEAQRTVRQIAEHKLDCISREDYGIDYLTSLEVEDVDCPWLEKSEGVQ